MKKNKKNNLSSKIRSAITGTSLCMFMTGYAWADDVIVARINFESETAVHIFKEISSVPQPDSTTLLAEALFIQAKSAEPDEQKTAFSKLEQAAKLGNAEAQFHAALMILDSEYVNRAEEDALVLLAKARDQGHTQAQYALDYVSNNDSFGIGC
jgi:TPR repeat protein